MIDIVDAKTRSRMMSNIRGKDTKPEMILRRGIHARGFRFCLHVSYLPGKPDLVFPKYNAVCFVNGCFWHRHTECELSYIPKSNTEIWKDKFTRTIERDKQVRKKLLQLDWRVITVWECVLHLEYQTNTINSVISWLSSQQSQMEIPVID